MIRITLLLMLALTGCASLDDGTYTPGVEQVARQDPKLLQCAADAFPVCRTSVSRVQKTHSACRCQ